MRKLIYILSAVISLLPLVTTGQTFTMRTNGTFTPTDPRLNVTKNLYIPRVCDTVGALQGGLDTLGALIYDKCAHTLWIRDTIPGGHKWTQVSGNSANVPNWCNLPSTSVDTTGTIDASATIQALVNAGCRYIQLPRGTLLFSNTVQMRDSVTIRGLGMQNTIIKLNTDIPAFKCQKSLGGTQCEFADLGFKGSRGPGASGDGLQTGIQLDTVDGVNIRNITASYLGGWAVRIRAYGNREGAYTWDATKGNQVRNLYARVCYGGVFLDTTAEYCLVTGCTIINGIYGIKVAGGNNRIIDNNVTSNSYNLYLTGGDNNGHGIASGNVMNHATQANVYITDVSTGFDLTGNLFWVGKIKIFNSVNIAFRSCDIVGSDSIIHENNIGTRFTDCRFPGNNVDGAEAHRWRIVGNSPTLFNVGVEGKGGIKDGQVSAMNMDSTLATTSGGAVGAYVWGNPWAADKKIGSLIFGVNPSTNGTPAQNGASIRALSDGAWTTGSSYPTKISFNTVPSGSITELERMRISESGKLHLYSVDSVGTSTGGFLFKDFATGQVKMGPGSGSFILNQTAAAQTGGFRVQGATITGNSSSYRQALAFGIGAATYVATTGSWGFALERSSADGTGGNFTFFKTRSSDFNTLGTNAVLEDLGSINFQGVSSNLSVVQTANIYARVKKVGTNFISPEIDFSLTDSTGAGIGIIRMKLSGEGNLGVGIDTQTPQSFVHLGAGSATRSPLKFTAGTNLTTPADGVVEYDGTHYYGTIGSTRYQLDQQTTGITNIATGAQTATGSYTQNWNNFPLIINNMSGIFLTATGTHVGLNKRTSVSSAPNTTFPLTIAHIIRNVANSADSAAVTIQYTPEAMILSTNDAGGTASIELNHAGTKDVILKGDSIRIQAPKALSDSQFLVGPWDDLTKTNSIVKAPKDSVATLIPSHFALNSFTDSTNFNTSMGVTFSSGKIVMSNGDAAGFAKWLSFKDTICSNHWRLATRIKQTATKASNTYGVSLGIRSVNSDAPHSYAIFPNTSDNADNGKFEFWTRNGAGTWAMISRNATAITNAQNDKLIMVMERRNSTLYLSMYNETTQAASTEATIAVSLTDAAAIMPNTGVPTLWVNSQAGSVEVDSFYFQDFEPKRSDMVFIGDSKTYGYGASAFADTYPSVLGKTFPSYGVYAGAGDKISDVKSRLQQIINAKPKVVIMAIGSNDVRFGTWNSTSQADYNYIDATLTAAGIYVLHCLPFKETSIDLTAQKDWMVANSQLTGRIINTWNVTQEAGLLIGDGVHLNSKGYAKVADMIKAAPQVANRVHVLNINQ